MLPKMLTSLAHQSIQAEGFSNHCIQAQGDRNQDLIYYCFYVQIQIFD